MSGTPPLRSVRGLLLGGRRVEVSGQPVETLSVNAQIPAYRHDPNGTYLIEQTYLQIFEPLEGDARKPPVLLQHGGGMTGTVWERAADGRPGWLAAFLAAGYTVGVIDEVERGRAGFCAIPHVWDGPPMQRSMEAVWADFRIGARRDFPRQQLFAGSRFPVEAFENLARACVPRWLTNGASQYAGLELAVDTLGPCILISHSQGCVNAHRLAQARPEAVRALVAVEPAGGPAPGAQWPATPLLHLWGDYLSYSDLWTPLAFASQAFVEAASLVFSEVDRIVLADAGHPGHTHVPMLDRGAEAVAELILTWLEARSSL